MATQRGVAAITGTADAGTRGAARGGPRCAGRAPIGRCGLLAALALLACAPRAHDPGATGPAAPRHASEWPSYGNDPGGTRYAPLQTLTRENVGELQVAWTYHTGDVADGSQPGGSTSTFEATPILSTARSSSARPSTA